MIEIRDASENDIPTIQDLAEKTWWAGYGPILEKEQISYMLETIYSAKTMRKSILECSQRFLLLLEDGVAHGFASYGDWQEERRAWKIHKLYVLPECQGRGLGKKLIDEILARAASAGIKRVVLNVNRNNPAFHFYIRYGFSVLREEDIPIGRFWMNDYVMQINVA